ncbi:MAG: hypothetical protein WB421_19995 [Terriglobales bacterium]
MRIRRRLPVIFAVLLVIAAVALVVFLRKHAPPEPARLLPSADGFFYVNLELIRLANIAGKLPEVAHDPEYEQFIQATGFQFERDLDNAAFAIHYPSNPDPAKPGSDEVRYSEVLVGKFDGDRLRDYLRKLSSSIESYGPTDIYTIPLEGRTLRVAILGVNTVAASNHSDPLVIQGIIDRSRKLASPFGGPALLRQYYKHVPLASLGWFIFRVSPELNGTSHVPASPINLSFLFPKPTVVVASVRYLGAVHLRAEAFTGSKDDAIHATDQLKTYLTLFNSAEISVSGRGPDPDVKEFFGSLKVEQDSDRTVLTAIVPSGFIRKAVADAPNAVSTPAPLQPARKAVAPAKSGP